VSIIGTSKTAFTISLLIPLVVLALPILDTFVTIVRRTSSGRKITEGDRGHFHHQLVFRFGLNVRQAVLADLRVMRSARIVAFLLSGGIASLRLAQAGIFRYGGYTTVVVDGSAQDYGRDGNAAGHHQDGAVVAALRAGRHPPSKRSCA